MKTDQRMPDHHSVPEQEGVDAASYLERVLEDVVDTIMTFGEYQQPRFNRLFTSAARPRLFDLQEWLTDNWSAEDIANFAMCALVDFGLDFAERRHREADRVRGQLMVELKDADFVMDMAEQLAEEAIWPKHAEDETD